MVMRERLTYYKKRDLTRLQSNKCCSIITYEADQYAFGIPHFATKTKDENGNASNMRLIGILENASLNELH